MENEIKNFQIYSKYYNLLYKDKDYYEEVRYLTGLIEKFNPNAKEILEFGSGTGSHAILLQEQGYNIFGIERSETMIEEAIKKGIKCQKGDIRSFNSTNAYDVVISMFHVISYLTENDDLLNTFKSAYNSLNENGIFIFDAWFSPAVYEQKAIPRIKTFKSDELSVIRFSEPKIDNSRNVIDVKFTIIVNDLLNGEVSELIEYHPMRHFSIPEITFFAHIVGFDVIKIEELITGLEPSSLTWGVCFVLKKR